MGNILITSFEPFGLSGRFLRNANASGDITDLLKKTHGDRCDFLTLPVSIEAGAILEDYLVTHRPSGVIGLGENWMMPNTVQAEPFAHDLPPTFNMLAALGQKPIHSPFAQTLSEQPLRSGIGVFHCNAVYKTALQWCESNGQVPAVFMHVAVIGNRADQTRKVIAVLDRMQNKISADKTRPGI